MPAAPAEPAVASARHELRPLRLKAASAHALENQNVDSCLDPAQGPLRVSAGHPSNGIEAVHCRWVFQRLLTGFSDSKQPSTSKQEALLQLFTVYFLQWASHVRDIPRARKTFQKNASTEQHVGGGSWDITLASEGAAIEGVRGWKGFRGLVGFWRGAGEAKVWRNNAEPPLVAQHWLQCFSATASAAQYQ